MVATTSLTLCLGIITTAVAAELPVSETYTVHVLKNFDVSVTGMNDQGIVSGRGNVDTASDYFPHAGTWDETGTFTDLDPNFLNDSSIAMGINNSGDVVGWFGGFANQLSGPVLFTNGNITPLLDQNGAEDPNGQARDINDNGLIVGCANTVPVTWDFNRIATPIAGTPDGATGCARATNNLGHIAGFTKVNGDKHATLWRDGVMLNLGALPGHEYSMAYGINELGQIVGTSRDTDGSNGNEQHPFLWDNGVMTDLGTLSGTWGIAYDINNAGHIVGTAPGPFLYRDNVMFDLKPVARLLSSANAINENGQIAGSSYVLTPAPNQLDMTVALTAPTGPIDSGTEYNYEITVTNRSSVDGEGVRLENSLSSPLQVISVSSDQGSCSSTAPVICDLGTVAADSSVNIVLRVKPEVPFSTSGNLVFVSNYARVSSSNTDINGANNSAYQSTRITPPPEPEGADVGVSLSDSPDPLRKGNNLTYTATVVNNGPLTAVNTVYTQSIYTRFSIKLIKTTHGDCSGKSTITCNLGDLAANERVTVTVEVRPKVQGGTSFFSTANIKSDSYDPVVNNNSTSVMTSVR
jgi:uncharacterized repeat protein (TIGR01451 family)